MDTKHRVARGEMTQQMASLGIGTGSTTGRDEGCCTTFRVKEPPDNNNTAHKLLCCSPPERLDPSHYRCISQCNFCTVEQGLRGG